MSQTRRLPVKRSELGSASGPLRLVAAALTLPVCSLLLVAASALASEVYSGVSRSILSGLRWRLDPMALSAEAVALAPWRSEPHLLAAQITSTHRRMADAADLAGQAALTSPADARIWTYWARLRGSADRYDAALTAAYRLASRRAPYEHNIQRSIAADGLLRWRHGDEALREIWTASIAYTIFREPKPFLLSVTRQGRDPYFCATVGKRLPLDQWCTVTARARVACLAPRIDTKTANWCHHVGFPVTGRIDDSRRR